MVREVTARMSKRGEAEQEFDRDFWRSIPPARRLELLSDMVLESDVWQGGAGRPTRLQKSVVRWRRRPDLE